MTPKLLQNKFYAFLLSNFHLSTILNILTNFANLFHHLYKLNILIVQKNLLSILYFPKSVDKVKAYNSPIK